MKKNANQEQLDFEQPVLEEAQYTELENDKPIDVSDFEEIKRTCNRKRKRRRAILIETIATGSSGNCYVLNDGRTTLLLEAGKLNVFKSISNIKQDI